MQLTEIQLTLSSAEDEASRFMGTASADLPKPPSYGSLPEGNYRVVNGVLFRIDEGLLPFP